MLVNRVWLQYASQSHYIEIAQGDIFMEQKMLFGLILGRLAILKKNGWADYEQLLREVFSCFQGHFFWKHYSVRTKKLHNIFLNFFKNFLKIFLNFFFGIKGLRTFSNVNVLYKGLLLQDWVFNLGLKV